MTLESTFSVSALTTVFVANIQSLILTFVHILKIKWEASSERDVKSGKKSSSDNIRGKFVRLIVLGNRFLFIECSCHILSPSAGAVEGGAELNKNNSKTRFSHLDNASRCLGNHHYNDTSMTNKYFYRWLEDDRHRAPDIR